MKYSIALLLFSLFFTFTFLVSTSGADVVSHHETNVIELEPAGEGTYTLTVEASGEIQIVLTEENPHVDGDGLNDDAVTDVGPVFTVENVLERRHEATVWIDHDGDHVGFYVPGEGTIESQEEAVQLQPGESTTVALRVDTRGTDEVTLESIAVLATLKPAIGSPTESARPDKARGPAEDTEAPTASETPTETATETPTATPTAMVTPGTTPTSTPDRDPATGGDSSGSGMATSPTETETPREKAGVDTTLLGAVGTVVVAIGCGALLARRYDLV